MKGKLNMKGKSLAYTIFIVLTLSILLIYLLEYMSSIDVDTNENLSLSEYSNDSENSSYIKEGQAFIDDASNANTVLHVAINSNDHSTLVAAVQAADLENSLVNAGPLTVFAPTNDAFDKLPPGTVSNLLKKENKNKLAFILKHHVTPGNYSKDFIKKFKQLGQASNENVSIKVKGDDVYIGEAKIIASVKASNGVVHIIDKVILP